MKIKLLALLALLPLSLMAAEPKASVTLQWDANTESTLAGYRVYQRTGTNQFALVAQLGKVTTVEVTGLAEKTQYTWVVTAFDDKNFESQPSNEVVYGVPEIKTPIPPSNPRVTKVIIEQVRVDTTTNTVTIFP